MSATKTKNTKKSGAEDKAKGGQSDKKSSAASTSKKIETVYRVDVNKGPVRQVSRKDAIKDALRSETFTEDTLNAMLDRGEVIPSPDYYYASTEKALSKWAVDAPPESAPLVEGDIVYSAERKVVGQLRNTGDERGIRIFFTDPEKGTEKSVAVTAKWGRANEKQAKQYRDSITLAEQTVEAEIVPEQDQPMTAAEKKELEKRERVITEKLEIAESLPMVIGEQLNEILAKRLFRESTDAEGNKFRTFGEYAADRFGITREYAYNLAQVSGYHAIAVDALPAKLKESGLSVNSTNALVRATNKHLKELGIDMVDGYDPIRPMIVNTMKVLGDVAPKDARTGQPKITPRLVAAVTETLGSVLKQGVVEIEGKQMSIADAEAKGVLGAAVQSEIIQVAAESIKANRQTLAEESRSAYERAIAPRQPAENGNAPGRKALYTGVVPSYGFSCDKHGGTKIIAIGSGTIQTKCRCRWRIDASSGNMVCFEVLGKKVKPAE